MRNVSLQSCCAWDGRIERFRYLYVQLQAWGRMFNAEGNPSAAAPAFVRFACRNGPNRAERADSLLMTFGTEASPTCGPRLWSAGLS